MYKSIYEYGCRDLFTNVRIHIPKKAASDAHERRKINKIDFPAFHYFDGRRKK